MLLLMPSLKGFFSLYAEYAKFQTFFEGRFRPYAVDLPTPYGVDDAGLCEAWRVQQMDLTGSHVPTFVKPGRHFFGALHREADTAPPV